MLVSKDDSKFLLHLVIWLLFLFVCNTSILLDMQPVYHPKMLAATSCGKNLYASQHSESPMSQKATITHLTEPSTSQIFYPPLPFQQAVVTAHLLPLSTQHSHRDGEILVVEWLAGREGGEKNLIKRLRSKRHLSSFVKGESLCSAAQHSFDSESSKLAQYWWVNQQRSAGLGEVGHWSGT